MGGMFISYRREDSAGWTGRIYDRLRSRFGAANVFMDVDDIPVGEDFSAVIASTLEQIDAVVVVIGPRWLTALDPMGRRRIDDPNDHLRREVASALRLDKAVIPVLVNDASMPPEVSLPEELRPLALRNAVVVSALRFDSDVGRLLDAVERAVEIPERPEVEAAKPEAIQDTTKCPFCAETIKVEAVLCRYCGSRLDEPFTPAEARSTPLPPGTSPGTNARGELLPPGDLGDGAEPGTHEELATGDAPMKEQPTDPGSLDSVDEAAGSMGETSEAEGSPEKKVSAAADVALEQGKAPIALPAEEPAPREQDVLDSAALPAPPLRASSREEAPPQRAEAAEGDVGRSHRVWPWLIAAVVITVVTGVGVVLVGTRDGRSPPTATIPELAEIATCEDAAEVYLSVTQQIIDLLEATPNAAQEQFVTVLDADWDYPDFAYLPDDVEGPVVELFQWVNGPFQDHEESIDCYEYCSVDPNELTGSGPVYRSMVNWYTDNCSGDDLG